MARIRTIKPEFWRSEQVTECSAMARLMFIGLWNFCDDGGRMPYSPKNIKMSIFPGDDITKDDIHRMIVELSSNGLIALYEYDNRQYLRITGWKHQRIDRPTYQYPDENGVIPESKGFTGRGTHRALDEASTPEGNGGEWKGEERKGREGRGKEGGWVMRTRHKHDPPKPFTDWPHDYREQFAAAYPEKIGMEGALKALDGVCGTVAWSVVLDALATYTTTKPPHREWVYPKRWIEEKRWNDRPASPAGNGSHVTDADIAAQLAREAGERKRSAQASGGEARRRGGLPVGGADAQKPGAPGG